LFDELARASHRDNAFRGIRADHDLADLREILVDDEASLDGLL
jgi:hypothetical protein